VRIVFDYMGLLLTGIATVFWAKFAGTVISTPQDVWINPPLENWMPYQFALLAIAWGILGTFFTSIGIWTALQWKLRITYLIVGIACCLAAILSFFYPMLKKHDELDGGDFIWLLISLLPGLVCIIKGIVTRKSKIEAKRF
jgi:hypothetical protein